MIVSTTNEYGELRSALVGAVDNFAWPVDDTAFNTDVYENTEYSETGFINQPLSNKVINEAKEDLQKLVDTLEGRGIKVYRPTTNEPHWANSARDILLTVGNNVIQCPTPFTTRANEIDLYPEIKQMECNIIKAPRPNSIDDPMFDAANVLKVGDKLVYSLSHSANEAGATWLQEQVGTAFEVIKWHEVKYKITHIDSTLLSCGKNTIIANGERLNVDTLPAFMRDYKIIWVNDCVPREFDYFPFCSKWIGMNVLSLDPETIIVDEIQTNFIEQLKQAKFNVVALPMRQSRTLGGGFHCVTCDLERS